MLTMYVNILVQGLTKFLKDESSKDGASEENLRLVIKLNKGELGAYLYDGPKFKRKVDFVELVKLLF